MPASLAPRWYRDGLVAVSNGSAIVTGTGSLWNVSNATRPGDLFTLDGSQFYEVASVDTNVQLTLATVFTGATATGVEYALIRNFTVTPTADILVEMIGLITTWHYRESELLELQTAADSGDTQNPTEVTLHAAGGQTITLKSFPQMLGDIDRAVAAGQVGPQGVQGVQGPAGPLNNWRGPWAASTAYAVGDVVYATPNSYIATAAHTATINSHPVTGEFATSFWSIAAAGTIGPQGIQGPVGALGPRGYGWTAGSGAPSNAVGVNGDFYLDGVTGDVYRRDVGVYAIIHNIKGLQGIQGIQGVQGIQGLQGVIGLTGARGALWTSGVGAPSNAVGENGDHYINVSNGDVYRRDAGVYGIVANVKGPQGIQGIQGIVGPTGVRGSIWTSGAGVPSNGTGIDGDHYINVSNGDVYRRDAGVYGVITNIEGSQGIQGIQGVIGNTGAAIVWRGAWSVASVNYAALDMVANGGNSYVCTAAHTSAAGTEPGVGGTWATKWDLAAQGGSTTVADDQITNQKLANMATQTIKGRDTAGTGDPEDLSVAILKTMLGLANMAYQTPGAVAITGGTINGTTIGATVAAAGIFSALTAKSTGGTILSTSDSANAAARNFAFGQLTGFGQLDIKISAALGGDATAGSTIFALTATGINGTVIGATTPALGKFTGVYLAQGGADGSFVWNSLDGPIRFGTNDVERGRLTNTGLNGMAIGATTPSTGSFTTIGATGASVLQGTMVIGGNVAHASYDAGITKAIVYGATNSGISIISGTASYGSIYFGDGTDATGAAYEGGFEYYHLDNRMKIWAGNANSGTAPQLFLHASGNVSIGNSTDAAKLNVTGSIKSSGPITPAGGYQHCDGGGTWAVPDDAQTLYYSNLHYFITANGADAGAVKANGFYTTNTAATILGRVMSSDVDNGLIVGTASSHDIRLMRGGAIVADVKSSGLFSYYDLTAQRQIFVTDVYDNGLWSSPTTVVLQDNNGMVQKMQVSSNQTITIGGLGGKYSRNEIFIHNNSGSAVTLTWGSTWRQAPNFTSLAAGFTARIPYINDGAYGWAEQHYIISGDARPT